MSLPRHIKLAGLRYIENKLAEILNPTLGTMQAKKTKELNTAPSVNIPKVVNFPSS